MNIVNANEKMLLKREIVIISMGPIQSGEITKYFRVRKLLCDAEVNLMWL